MLGEGAQISVDDVRESFQVIPALAEFLTDGFWPCQPHAVSFQS